jgi:hypothetical protein
MPVGALFSASRSTNCLISFSLLPRRLARRGICDRLLPPDADAS